MVEKADDAPCPCCGTIKPAFAIQDHPKVGLACDWCRIDADRDHHPIYHQIATGEIILDHLRDERLRRLIATDWIEVPRNRARHTSDFVAAMDAYREALHKVVDDAKQGRKTPWPDLPLSPGSQP